jgi:hypothetical protein
MELNGVDISFLHLRAETLPVSETLYSLVFGNPEMDKVQKPSNSECKPIASNNSQTNN